uniref:UTP3 small subunit processome component n=2 Tax=Eptatretus burgeri TaxID=7764 RepID=A0A8C4R813_EPTBU
MEMTIWTECQVLWLGATTSRHFTSLTKFARVSKLVICSLSVPPPSVSLISNLPPSPPEPIHYLPSFIWYLCMFMIFILVSGGKKPLQGEIEERAEEEKEAREIQRRQAEELQLSDFGLDLIQDHAPLPSCVPDEEQDHDAELPALERSVSLHGGIKGLSASSIRRLILADSPELPRLVLDLKAKLLSLRDELCPLIDFLAEKRIPTGKGAEFLQTKYHLYFNYCVNIMFYLALKGQRSLGSHPVIHRLLQYRNLVNDIAEIETESLKLEIHKLLANPPKLPEPSPMTAINTAALGSQSSEGTVKEKKNEEEEALNYYEEMVRRLKERREMKERNSEQPIVETQTPNTGKRKITLQIAKNKGLTPKRKKLDRNPRVKHKEKYRRALVRHKSQVLTVRHKVSAYGGERTGIRAGVRKGIKLQVLLSHHAVLRRHLREDVHHHDAIS